MLEKYFENTLFLFLKIDYICRLGFSVLYFLLHLKSIVHGRGGNLIDPRTIHEYDGMNNRIGYWDREVIYYYIDNFQNRN